MSRPFVTAIARRACYREDLAWPSRTDERRVLPIRIQNTTGPTSGEGLYPDGRATYDLRIVATTDDAQSITSLTYDFASGEALVVYVDLTHVTSGRVHVNVIVALRGAREFDWPETRILTQVAREVTIAAA